MANADVTICIPAWQAEPFIERTLACARAQTHENIRILVSIDRCDDGTEAICRREAALDSRIDVRHQPERLGWSRNVNYLLEQVDTEFCFLYFHDDIIEPTYTARLRQMLIDDPGAQSAQCDMDLFGDRTGVVPATEYAGTAAERLIRLLADASASSPRTLFRSGTLLRCLFRSDVIGKGLRLPVIAGDGFWRCHPFLMTLVAAGPARHLPEALYHRWIRQDGLKATLDPAKQAALIDGQQQSALLCLRLIESLNLPAAEKEMVNFCLFIFMMTWTRVHELRLNARKLADPDTISGRFGNIHLPKDLSGFDPALVETVLRAYGTLLSLEGKHALDIGDERSALPRLAAAISLNPRLGASHARLGKILESGGLRQSARAVRQRVRHLQTLEDDFEADES